MKKSPFGMWLFASHVVRSRFRSAARADAPALTCMLLQATYAVTSGGYGPLCALDKADKY